MATVVVVDDHILMRTGLVALIRQLGHKVLYEADNGEELVRKLPRAEIPDIVMLDINMPLMDGFATAQWLKVNYPAIKVLVLSMYDDEQSIIRMIKHGAKGYILKDCEPAELKKALEALQVRGFYHSELLSSTLMQVLQENAEAKPVMNNWGLTERELHFLQLACSEMTYKEIAEKMYVSPRTIEDYRDELYRKLNIRSRVGLVLFAIRHGIVKV